MSLVRMRTLDAATQAEVVARYQAGETLRELAADYGGSVRRIRTALDAARVPLRRTGPRGPTGPRPWPWPPPTPARKRPLPPSQAAATAVDSEPPQVTSNVGLQAAQWATRVVLEAYLNRTLTTTARLQPRYQESRPGQQK